MRWPFRRKAKHKCRACWVEGEAPSKAKWRWTSPYGNIVYICNHHCSNWIKASGDDPLMLPWRLEKL